MMIGRSVADYFPQHISGKAGEVVLRVNNLSSPGLFRDVNFEIRAGEIVGFAGLVGSGRSEIAKAIFGLDRNATGEVELNGKPLPMGSTSTSMAAGIGLVPEDRKRQGLVLDLPIRANVSLAILDRLRGAIGMLKRRREEEVTGDYFGKLRVKASSMEAPPSSLSGGNQQKVVLAKWLARGGKLLIVDEPTRGVDVGAKAAIHELVDDLASQGLAVMLISSELPEVINLSTRHPGYARWHYRRRVIAPGSLQGIGSSLNGWRHHSDRQSCLTVAILAGNQSAPNLQNRVAGAKEALKKYPNMKLNEPGVFYHVETPEKAAEAVQQAQNANPGIQGWAMIGGWPLFTANAFEVAGGLDQSGGGRCAPCAAWLCQGWVCEGAPGPGLLWLGHQVGRDPARQDRQEPVPAYVKVIDPLTLVTKENVDSYAENWKKWLKK